MSSAVSSVDISPLVAATLALHARGRAKESRSGHDERGFLVLDGSPPEEDGSAA